MVGAGLTMLLLFLVVRESLTDDAYITLAYAKNLALHLHWGVIPQEFANTATSPLHVALVGAVAAVTRIAGAAHLMVALGVVSVAAAMAIAWAWTRIVRQLRLPLWVAALGVALVLFNPFLLSAVGLEVLLIPTCLTALLALALEGRVGWFGVVAGLTVLVRLDLILFVLPLAAATAQVRAHWARALGAAALVAGPWFLFSWISFGSAVPDTLVIKSSEQKWLGVWSYVTGPAMYYTFWPTTVLVAFAPAIGGGLAVIGWFVGRMSVRWTAADALPSLGPAAALGGGALAYYLAYVVMDVAPYHWYFVPVLAAFSTFAVIAAGAWWVSARERSRLRPAAPAIALGILALLAIGNLAADLKQGVPWSRPVIFTNLATARDYARVGEAVRERVGSDTVTSPGEIGTIAFYCECAIVDAFSDRGLTIKEIEAAEDDAPAPLRQLLELNYLWLERSRRPRAVDYQLSYAPGPGSGPNVWEVQSGGVARSTGHFTLKARGRAFRDYDGGRGHGRTRYRGGTQRPP